MPTPARHAALLCALAAGFPATSASAIDLGVGLAGVDGMDDHMEPAATARVGWTDGLYSQAYFWGRDFGPVKERNVAVTFAGEAHIGGSPYFVAHYGAAATEHALALDGGAAGVQRDRDYNLGGVLGLGLTAHVGPLRFATSWDSHIFLTGSAFIVFLATARKQTVSVVMGVDL